MFDQIKDKGCLVLEQLDCELLDLADNLCRLPRVHVQGTMCTYSENGILRVTRFGNE